MINCPNNARRIFFFLCLMFVTSIKMIFGFFVGVVVVDASFRTQFFAKLKQIKAVASKSTECETIPKIIQSTSKMRKEKKKEKFLWFIWIVNEMGHLLHWNENNRNCAYEVVQIWTFSMNFGVYSKFSRISNELYLFTSVFLSLSLLFSLSYRIRSENALTFEWFARFIFKIYYHFQAVVLVRFKSNCCGFFSYHFSFSLMTHLRTLKLACSHSFRKKFFWPELGYLFQCGWIDIS